MRRTRTERALDWLEHWYDEITDWKDQLLSGADWKDFRFEDIVKKAKANYKKLEVLINCLSEYRLKKEWLEKLQKISSIISEARKKLVSKERENDE